MKEAAFITSGWLVAVLVSGMGCNSWALSRFAKDGVCVSGKQKTFSSFSLEGNVLTGAFSTRDGVLFSPVSGASSMSDSE